jgi:hypothetical protein
VILRSTNASSGYLSASGGANVFLTGSNSNSSFNISSIEILNNASSGTLCFGVRKNAIASNGSELSISYSGATGSSGITLPTGSGTTSWQYRLYRPDISIRVKYLYPSQIIQRKLYSLDLMI